MKRFQGTYLYIPSVTEIRKAVQHYNRLNRSRENFYGDNVRKLWYSLYWDFAQGHFIWHEHCAERSYMQGEYLCGIDCSRSPVQIRADLVFWLTGFAF